MKRLIGIMVLCCALLSTAHAQENKDTVAKQEAPPYLKYPKLPAFNIMLPDSSTIFNTYNIPKGKPIAILFFDPDCKHCRSFTESLVKGMDSVKNVRFYMVTFNHNFGNLRDYYKNYELDKYKNIEAVGRDYEFFVMSYYSAKHLPTLALYDGDKKLVTLIDGVKNVTEIYEWTSKLKK